MRAGRKSLAAKELPQPSTPTAGRRGAAAVPGNVKVSLSQDFSSKDVRFCRFDSLIGEQSTYLYLILSKLGKRAKTHIPLDQQ